MIQVIKLHVKYLYFQTYYPTFIYFTDLLFNNKDSTITILLIVSVVVYLRKKRKSVKCDLNSIPTKYMVISTNLSEPLYCYGLLYEEMNKSNHTKNIIIGRQLALSVFPCFSEMFTIVAVPGIMIILNSFRNRA